MRQECPVLTLSACIQRQQHTIGNPVHTFTLSGAWYQSPGVVYHRQTGEIHNSESAFPHLLRDYAF